MIICRFKVISLLNSCNFHCYIRTDSEALLNNLPNNLEYLCFEDLGLPLTNLPYLLIELKLKECDQVDIKLPYGCKKIDL